MVIHADSNSFYSACEQIYRPDLRRKLVAVLSNNNGVIIALTKEAKEHGGVFVYNPREVDALLESTNCSTIWGIGPARAKKLLLHGINVPILGASWIYENDFFGTFF